MTTNGRRPIIADALWSVQRALFDEVLPNLRAVTVAIQDEVRLRFIYDCPIDEDLRTITYSVDAEVTADFPDDEVTSVTETWMDGPITLSPEEVPAYHRREPEPLVMTATSAHPGARPEFLQDPETWTVHETRRALGRLAVQAALLGEVTPDLRVVIIDPTHHLRVRMIYDRPIDAEIKATVARVDAGTKANLHLDERVTTRAECIPEGPVPGPEGEVNAYKRNEGLW